MYHFVRRQWDLPPHQQTPVEIYRDRGFHRREFLRMLGLAGMGAVASLPSSGCSQPTAEEIKQAGAVEQLPTASAEIYPADRNQMFEYGRPETTQLAAAQYTNFFEFSTGKDSWRYVKEFQPYPWNVEIDGLCAKPTTLDIDDIHKQFDFEERAYRHRCVETWAMCVPWTGFPLAELIKSVEPKPAAKYVQFTSFTRPNEAAMMKNSSFPWPYTEGLSIEEAMNELAFAATGIYGEPLPKQHGAPIRVVIPWKYGFKGIKSITKITLTDKRPSTFWNSYAPNEYGFEANVDPKVPHPRWPQNSEWMLGTRERYPTEPYNGYGEFVAKLYA